MKKNTDGSISIQTFRRLPGYYNCIKSLRSKGMDTVSAPTIAKDMGLNEVQVRKDLAAVSIYGGQPRIGFKADDLLDSIGAFLGYNNVKDAILIGVGQLGRALLTYKGFEENGVRIVTAFDSVAPPGGMIFAEKKIFPMEKFPELCRRLNIHIGIITVPANAAQEICDKMVECGILAIWNFAPVHLNAPSDVLIHNENMALSLALLSQHLTEKMNNKHSPLL